MTDTKRLAEELRKRILPEHGGTADSYKHHWNLNAKDSLLHKEAADLIARLPEIQRDAERLNYIESQMHTNCSVSMDGMLRWSPRHTFRSLRGQTFRDAIDAAIAASSTGDAGEGS